MGTNSSNEPNSRAKLIFSPWINCCGSGSSKQEATTIKYHGERDNDETDDDESNENDDDYINQQTEKSIISSQSPQNKASQLPIMSTEGKRMSAILIFSNNHYNESNQSVNERTSSSTIHSSKNYDNIHTPTSVASTSSHITTSNHQHHKRIATISNIITSPTMAPIINTQYSDDATLLLIQYNKEKHLHSNRHKSKSNIAKLKRQPTAFQIEMNRNPPPILPCHPSNILYYYDNITETEYALAFTEYKMFNNENTSGIYQYNLKTQKFQKLTNYTMEPKQFMPTIDYINKQIHIYGRHTTVNTTHPLWGIYDIKSNKWNITAKDDLKTFNVLDIHCTASIIVDGQLYIFGQNRFGRFDQSTLKFDEIGYIGIQNRYLWEVNSVVYVKEQHRIYIFGICPSIPAFTRMWYDDIYYLKLSRKRKKIKWKKFKLHLPYYTIGVFADYSFVLGYKHILFLFYHKKKELWCLDLLYQKRFTSTKSFQIKLANFSKLLLSNDNTLHSLCFDSNGPIHIKLSLTEVIKDELSSVYAQLKADLICGYVKQMFSSHYKLSLKIKTMIFKYSDMDYIRM